MRQILAFILLVIISFENEQQHSSSLVSATPLQRFKMKHEPSKEWNGISQKTNESQFDGVQRVRRSNRVYLNTQNNNDKKVSVYIYVGGGGALLAILTFLVKVCC